MKLVCALFFLLTSSAHGKFTESVNLFIGTGAGNVIDGVPGGKSGGTQPGAVLPFGMVNFGPDTDRPENSGYDDSNSFMRGFSFTHLSGPGCRNTGEFPILPAVQGTRWPSPGIAFKKVNQTATPGYYRVQLENGITTELTATLRTGMARFTGNTPFTLLLSTERNGSGQTRGTFRQTGPGSFRAMVRGGDFCAAKNFYDVYIAIEVSSPAKSVTYQNGVAAIQFSENEIVLRAGLSYVSEEGALRNLAEENPEFDFGAIQNKASSEWERALGSIDVTGGTSDERTLFYTSLYRSLLHPNLSSDVTGDYMGFDHRIHRDEKRPHYHNYSGWDIYRSQVQLLAFLFPERASDLAQSLVDSGTQCGALPRWGQNNAETAIMVGDPGSIILANFSAFGAENFDHQTALQLMLRSAFDPEAKCQNRIARPGLKEYMERGFIPEPTAGVWGPAATTLEYASADFAVSQFAKSLGKIHEGEILLRRSGNWKNLFDDETRLIRPRVASGEFLAPFSPVSLTGFVEGNSAQYTWMIPFDSEGLIERMGGNELAMKRLNLHHTSLNGGLSTPYLYIGNEPCFNTPYMYNRAGAPWKTQEMTRRLLTEEFRNSPGGLPGNDDLGALGSFYVWTSLGIFPSIPGVSGFSLTSPVFSRAVIRGRITIETDKSRGIYISNLKVDGKDLHSPWVDGNKFTNISVQMSSVPTDWGTTRD